MLDEEWIGTDREDRKLILSALENYKNTLKQMQINIIKSQTISLKISKEDVKIMEQLLEKRDKIDDLIERFEK